MPTPLDWSQEAVRFEFFVNLPQPLAVMLACDLASLLPQTKLGAAAIDTARRWLMGTATAEEVRSAARAAAHRARDETDPTYAAMRAAHTVHASPIYLAYSASTVCESVFKSASLRKAPLETATYEGQSRRVEFLRQAMQAEQVRLLAEAQRDDPAVRPILWDAMLDAGYTPEPTRRA